MPDGRASAIPAYRLPRAARPISPGSVADRFPELVEARAKLDAVRIAHLDLTKRVLEADGGRTSLSWRCSSAVTVWWTP
jgi:hypothetical protein